MNDLIDRQKAIEAMSNVNDSICGQQAIDELLELPSENEWIPVTKRLPEKYQYVLVTYNGLDGRRLVVVTNWNQNTWIESNSVAWMPVPEPYEEDCDE